MDHLITVGADLKLPGWHGCFPLHFAAKAGHLEIVSRLLKEGVDVNCVNNQNVTPLLFSLSNNHPRVSELLIERGANTQIQSEDGETPLHEASGHGQTEIVKRILKDGSSPWSATHWFGRTPLGLAIANSHVEIVRIFLSHTSGATEDADPS